MRCVVHLLLGLVLACFFGLAQVDGADWTDAKLDKTIAKMHQAADKKKWSRAILHGQEMLKGFAALDAHDSDRYAHQLKNLCTYYDKEGRLKDIADLVRLAYDQAKLHLSPDHNTTMVSRNLLYKLFVSEAKYRDALPLAQENVALSGSGRDGDFRRLYYVRQLFSLYGLMADFAAQEPVLEQYLELNSQLFGRHDNETKRILDLLATNYCRQGKVDKFQGVVVTYDLKLTCPVP